MIKLHANRLTGGVETEISLEGDPFDVIDEITLSVVHIINMIAKNKDIVSEEVDEEEAKYILLKCIMEMAGEYIDEDVYEKSKQDEEDSMEEDLF